MELIRTLREKQLSSKQADIEEMAMDVIKVKDFGNSLYIAYGGAPVVLVEKDWTSVEIINKLTELRKTFVEYKMKRRRTEGISAMF